MTNQKCIHRAGCPKPDVCEKVGHCTSMTTTDLEQQSAALRGELPPSKVCICKAEHWQPHAESCPAKVKRAINPSPTVDGSNLADETIRRQRAEITQLRGNLTLAEDGLAGAMQELAGTKADYLRRHNDAVDRYEALLKIQREIAGCGPDVSKDFLRLCLNSVQEIAFTALIPASAEPEKQS